MGTCGCTDRRFEVGGVMIGNQMDDPENLDNLKDENEDKQTLGMPPEIFLQALVRGYLERRSFSTPALAGDLQIIYESLPPFDIGPADDKTYQIMGGVFIGSVNKMNEPHGSGRLYLSTSIIEGHWSFGILNGECRVVNLNGEVFTGTFINNVREGYGELIGDTNYKGEWKNNVFHGRGEEIWKNGEKYQGEYYKSLRHGKGIFTWQDGSSYGGDFKNNTIEGFGTYIWSGGRRYTGQWKNNKMHGLGKFTWEDGRTYEGEYVENKKQGFGVLCFPSGKKYEGRWENGVQHGEGTLSSKKGTKKGIWNNGKYIG